MPTPPAPVILVSSNDQLLALRDKFAVRTIAQVVERLLLDFELTDLLPPAPIRCTRDAVVRIKVRTTDNERLRRLQAKLDYASVADVMLVVLQHHFRDVEPPPATPGEQHFADLLAYIYQKERAERAARKAARQARQQVAEREA